MWFLFGATRPAVGCRIILRVGDGQPVMSKLVEDDEHGLIWEDDDNTRSEASEEDWWCYIPRDVDISPGGTLVLPVSVDKTPGGKVVQWGKDKMEDGAYSENVEFNLEMNISGGMLHLSYYGEDDTRLSHDEITGLVDFAD
jgi:hypothetical protein